MKNTLAILFALAILVCGGVASAQMLSAIIGGASSPWAATNSGAGNSNGSSVTAQNLSAFARPLTNPSVIVVFAGGKYSGTLSVTDTAGNTYSDCGPGKVGLLSSSYQTECFCAPNTHTTSSNVVKVSSTVSGPSLFGDAVEITGPSSSCALDGGSGTGYSIAANATSGSAGANSLSVPSATTASSGDLILAGVNNDAGTLSAGTSPMAFTPFPVFLTGEYAFQPAAGSIAAAMGDTAGSVHYAMIQIALKP